MDALKLKHPFTLLRTPRGFTLLELVVSVTIIASLIAISTPRFRNTLDNLMFENFCRGLASRMEFLKERASVANAIYRMDFDSANHLFSIKVKKSDDEDFMQIRDILYRDIIAPKGVRINVSSPAIIFYPDGSIEAEAIEIVSQARLAVISINNSTGKITLDENI